MIRSWFACLKHILGALLLLVLLVCALEVGLRLHAAATGRADRRAADAPGLVIPCRQTHHRLGPLQKVAVANPDTGEPVEVALNSYGLRGPDPAVPKPPGVLRIVCLGDETTLAPDVPYDVTFCARLEHLLQSRSRIPVEVINAGVPGYCPLLSLLQVRYSLLALQADVLIVNFDTSDVADDHRYRRYTQFHGETALACPHPNFARPAAQGTQAMLESFVVTKCLMDTAGEWGGRPQPEDLCDIGTAQGRYAWLRDDMPPEWSVYIEQALGPLEELNRLAEGTRATLVVATYPAPWQVSRTACDGPGVRAGLGIAAGAIYGSRRPFELLADFTRGRRIFLCDASPMFLQFEQPDRLYLQNAPRFSRWGHELYARTLAAFVVRTVPGAWIESPPDERRTPPAPPLAERSPWPRSR